MKLYYEGQGIKLYHGDAIDGWDLPAGAVIVSDPPYGCDATTGWGGKYDGFELYGDKTTDARDWLVYAVVSGGHAAAIFGSPRIPRPPCKATLIWAKGEHTGMGDLTFPWKPDYEEVYIFGDGWSGERGSSVLRYMARTDSGRFHPTEKPVALMSSLIWRAPKGVICDPFCGSGSTLVAAKEMKREAIGIEMEERYCEIAARRLETCAVLPFSET